MERKTTAIFDSLTLRLCNGLSQRDPGGLSLQEETDTQRRLLVSKFILLANKDTCDIDHKLYIIGGWLGQGPLAADDMHILDL